MIDDDDIIPLPERLERLRQWRDATQSDMAELILDRLIISHMLDLIDKRSTPTYIPQTTETIRKQVMWAARDRMPGAEWYGLCSMLDDLKNAEAALGVDNDNG